MQRLFCVEWDEMIAYELEKTGEEAMVNGFKG
jgi:hypothetical protein